MNSDTLYDVFLIWSLIGFYYFFKIWWEPNLLFMGIGFTLGSILGDMINKK